MVNLVEKHQDFILTIIYSMNLQLEEVYNKEKQDYQIMEIKG